MVAANQLMPVRVGISESRSRRSRSPGTEATTGRTTRAAGDVLEAFGRAQDAIIEVAERMGSYSLADRQRPGPRTRDVPDWLPRAPVRGTKAPEHASSGPALSRCDPEAGGTRPLPADLAGFRGMMT